MKEKEIPNTMDVAKTFLSNKEERELYFRRELERLDSENGTPVARIIPQNQAISYLTDSLTGILKEESLEQVKEETLRGKYEHRRNPKDST